MGVTREQDKLPIYVYINQHNRQESKAKRKNVAMA